MRYVMRRGRRLAAVLTAALATAAVLGGGPVHAGPEPERQTRPNVLMVVLDDALDVDRMTRP